MADDKPVQYREGYCVGLSEGVAMFERCIEPLRAGGHTEVADGLEILVTNAKRKVSNYRAHPARF